MKRFNVRVYGLLLTPSRQLLLAEEQHGALAITKFPGGGLEFGEGTADCLQREWMEETGTQLTRLSHFYTTDFFQPSAFNPQDQVISIYYLVDSDTTPTQVPDTETALKQLVYEPLDLLTPDRLTMPIDKVVLQKLKDYFPA